MPRGWFRRNGDGLGRQGLGTKRHGLGTKRQGTGDQGSEGLSCTNRVRLILIGRLPGGERAGDRPLRLVIFGDPTALNVERRTEISVSLGAPFFGRRSANRTLEFQRGIVGGHTFLLPRSDQGCWSVLNAAGEQSDSGFWVVKRLLRHVKPGARLEPRGLFLRQGAERQELGN